MNRLNRCLSLMRAPGLTTAPPRPPQFVGLDRQLDDPIVELFGALEVKIRLPCVHTIKLALQRETVVLLRFQAAAVMDSFICSLLSAGILTLARRGQPFSKIRYSRSRGRILRKRMELGREG